MRVLAIALPLLVVLGPASAQDVSVAEQEGQYLANTRQVTFGLPRAGEGYFSPDGQFIVYQAYPIGYPFYQIYVQPLEERVPRLLSTGRGRTTCAYFSRDGQKVLFASAHTHPYMAEEEKRARELLTGGRSRRRRSAARGYGCTSTKSPRPAASRSPMGME